MDAFTSVPIPGYEFGAAESAGSPLRDEEIRQLEQTVGWTEEDAAVLRRHGELFALKAEAMVDAWRSTIGAQPHLSAWFAGPDGRPDDEYKARVRRRFVRWVVDVAIRPHDRDWLNYQEEIGLRHTPAKKNVADVRQTPSYVPLRYVLAFVPMVLPLKRFFAEAITEDGELDALEGAWTKAVLLHVTLWTRAYTVQELW